MITLDSTIDDALIARCSVNSDGADLRFELEKVAREYCLSGAEVFNVDYQHRITEENVRDLRRANEYLHDHLSQANQLMAPVFPRLPHERRHHVRFILIPMSPVCFGPQAGIQFFGIDPNANPREMFLFLAHVCYHEVSAFGYTHRCETVSANQASIEDTIYWIKLQIRNEGIANYPILSEVEDLLRHEPGYSCRYFTYAHWIDVASYLRAAGFWLNEQVKTQCNGDYQLLVANLKRYGVPSINLLGIAMCQVIAEYDGMSSLSELACRDPEVFFRRYEEIQTISGRRSVVPDILR